MDAAAYFKTRNYKSSTQNRLVSLAENVAGKGKDAVVSYSFGPLVAIARTIIIALMEKISHGQLRVLTKEGIYVFGTPRVEVSDHLPGDDGTGELRAELRVVNDAFWVRMLILSDLGFAEAVLVGDVLVDNLDNVFKMFILNRSNLSDLSMTTSHVFSALNTLMNSRFVNSISNSISNISAHYDISNRMFSAFLSRDMTYSCAIFGDEEGGPEGDRVPTERTRGRKEHDMLEDAQLRKIRRVIERAHIGNGDRVLEIGSGWGSFALEAVRSCGCTVDTLTLSIEQKELAEARIAEAGLSDKIKVHLLDYRNIPAEWNGAFDRLVSIEMIEAVGIEYLDGYFEIVDRALKKDRGIAVFQVITMPDGRFERYKNEVDFIKKYIFPGGVLPSVTFMVDCIRRGSKGKLVIESMENIGPHYSRTLRAWRYAFENQFESEIVPALREAYPEIKSREQIEVFRRKWIYYFSYCIAGFEMRAIGDHIISVTREGNLSIPIK